MKYINGFIRKLKRRMKFKQSPHYNLDVNTHKEKKYFSFNDVRSLYTAMTKAGCISLTSGEFSSSIANGDNIGKYLVKHDVHHDLEKTVCFAEQESRLGIKAVYFVMPEHELTKSYFNSTEMWKSYKKIHSLGHEIALHLDIHDLVLKFGSIYRGIENTLSIFSDNGFHIKTANLHGNTALRKLYGSAKALLRRNDSDSLSLAHKHPICDAYFKSFYASQSLESLGRELGVINWIDAEFMRMGNKIDVPSHCSDNTGSFRLGCNGKRVFESEPYFIDRGLCDRIAQHCMKSTTLFLMHPQSYIFS